MTGTTKPLRRMPVKRHENASLGHALFAYHRTWRERKPFTDFYRTAKKNPRIGDNIYVISGDSPRKPKYFLEGLYIITGIGNQGGKKRELLMEPLMRCAEPPCINAQSWFDNKKFHDVFTAGSSMSRFPLVYENRFYDLLYNNNPTFGSDSAKDSLDDIGSDIPQRRAGVRSFVVRDPKVRKAVLERANGKCEYCNKTGFECGDGVLYLESHHIIALASDGKDRMSKVIAVCADDHRPAHFAANREEIERRMVEIVTSFCPA